MTISPVDFCPLCPAFVDELMDWWNGCRYVVSNLINAGLIKGAFVLESVAIASYWPQVKCRPHVHVVIVADDVTEETFSHLNESLSSYRAEWWDGRKKRWQKPVYSDPEPLWSRASTRTYELKHDYDFASVLSYMCNPVNFAKAYIEDRTRVTGSRSQARQLNTNVFDAIDGYIAATFGRWAHNYFGVLQHAHRDFKGICKKKRETKAFERLIKFELSECQIKRVMHFDPEKLGPSVESEVRDARSREDQE